MAIKISFSLKIHYNIYKSMLFFINLHSKINDKMKNHKIIKYRSPYQGYGVNCIFRFSLFISHFQLCKR